MAGVDLGAVVAAAIGAVGGGLATGVGGFLRERSGARTAARLIYGELTRNGAPVAYFRASGIWPATSLTYTAWDRHARELAQMRRSATFEAARSGYAALEAIHYIASGADLGEPYRGRLLERAVGDLAAALRATGEVARIPRGSLDGVLRPLTRAAPTADPPAPVLAAGGLVPPMILTGMLDRGNVEQQLSAARSRLPAEALRHPALPAQSVTGGQRFAVYDAGHQENLDAVTLLRATGDPPVGDPVVDDAYEAMVATSEFARKVLGRDSLTGGTEPLSAVVHYGRGFNNAFWNGQLVVVGDGDDVAFRSFTNLDILAHELFHSVPEIGTLSFYGQSGSLVESICDVFGALVVQHHLGQTAEEASWVLGENMFTENIKGIGLRSLKAPGTAYDDPVLGKDPQGAHMDDFNDTTNDNGGVHINCGIPSHAFYRLAVALGGYAWERAGLIWYDAATSHPDTTELDFATFARRTIAAAERRYGPGGDELRETENAWNAVGVRPAP
ncbi:MAG TPA: M4 family metallopeptidase [Streptosporangiaceae bacterium]